MKKLLQAVILQAALLFSSFVFAAVQSWQIVPAESSINFTATQNDAPVSGHFKTFSGDIVFDPTQLNASHVKIIVDTASIAVAYSEVLDALKQKDWLDIKVFPNAVFESTEISKTGDKTFAAKGNLTIRDKTLPVTVNFTQVEYSDTKAVMQGSATLQRTQFGVGQGEWADTNGVKDDVKVDFTMTAVNKK